MFNRCLFLRARAPGLGARSERLKLAPHGPAGQRALSFSVVEGRSSITPPVPPTLSPALTCRGPGGARPRGRDHRAEGLRTQRDGWSLRMSALRTSTTTTPPVSVTPKSFTTMHASSVRPSGGYGVAKFPFSKI